MDAFFASGKKTTAYAREIVNGQDQMVLFSQREIGFAIHALANGATHPRRNNVWPSS